MSLVLFEKKSSSHLIPHVLCIVTLHFSFFVKKVVNAVSQGTRSLNAPRKLWIHSILNSSTPRLYSQW